MGTVKVVIYYLRFRGFEAFRVKNSSAVVTFKVWET